MNRIDSGVEFREPGAAQAGGYVLICAGVLVAAGLIFHPFPVGGFEEQPSILEATPWWGAIHVAIAFGFVLCVLAGLLILVGGGMATRHWTHAFCWGAVTVGMIYFTGVALINGWVIHDIDATSELTRPLYDAMNDLLIGFGWLGNPLFLVGLTGITLIEVRHRVIGIPHLLAWGGVIVALLSWGRGIGSATGMFFLEPLIVANIPAFLWFGYYGWGIARKAASQMRRQKLFQSIPDPGSGG